MTPAAVLRAPAALVNMLFPGSSKRRVIEQIVSLRPELDAEGFRDLRHFRVLEHGHVKLATIPGTDDGRPACIAKRVPAAGNV